ncbi:MAG: hypothetical protein LC798_13165 [Chloroflexi bacterium]|nr:hypothetical protein [Chloroflexota bacterium]
MKRGRRKRPPEGPLSRTDWEVAVYLLDAKRCIVTARRVPGRPSNFHHVVPKQRLRRDGRHDIVFDPANGVTVDERVHTWHETAYARIPRECLPERALRFAEEHGYGSIIERFYPAGGAHRQT